LQQTHQQGGGELHRAHCLRAWLPVVISSICSNSVRLQLRIVIFSLKIGLFSEKPANYREDNARNGEKWDIVLKLHNSINFTMYLENLKITCRYKILMLYIMFKISGKFPTGC